MKFLFDLFPVLLFFATFKWAHAFPVQAAALAASTVGSVLSAPLVAEQIPIVLATAVTLIASLLQVVWLKARGRKVEPMLWIGVFIITAFGGATIYLQNEIFIKWKPTILYWAFAVTLVFGALVLNKNLIRSVLGKNLQLPEPVWNQLNWAWVVFFAVAGALNLWVAFTTSTENWVNFKLFGLMGLTLLFSLGMGLWLSRHMKDPPRKRLQMSTNHTQTLDTMRARLQEEFKPSMLEIMDDSARHAGHAGAASGGGHFRLRLVSTAFSGQARLQRQRLVYDLLADLMKRDIHALSMILLAPDEASRDSGHSPSAN